MTLPKESTYEIEGKFVTLTAEVKPFVICTYKD